jgi:hypothetical protein
MTNYRALSAIFLAGTMVLSACGGGGDNASTDTSVPPVVTLPDVTDGLVASYNCNGNVDDSVGTADGVTSGDMGYVADRHDSANSACNFDGIDDKINVNSVISQAGSTGMSVSFWVKTSMPSFNGSEIYGLGTSWFSVNNLIQYTMIAGSTNSVSTTLSPDTWTHIVGTYDDATQLMKIFKNGVFVKEVIKGSSVGGLNLTSLEMGQAAWPAPTYWAGALDEIRLYGRPLSAVEVLQLYDYQK